MCLYVWLGRSKGHFQCNLYRLLHTAEKIEPGSAVLTHFVVHVLYGGMLTLLCHLSSVRSQHGDFILFICTVNSLTSGKVNMWWQDMISHQLILG